VIESDKIAVHFQATRDLIEILDRPRRSARQH
jgi:hypothetical protein